MNEEKDLQRDLPRRLSGKASGRKNGRLQGEDRSLKEKKVPELNDEFAQGSGRVQDPRRASRENPCRIMEKHKREHANEEMRDKLLDWLEDNNEFEVPETLVERQIQIRMQRLVRDLSRQGINPQRLDVDWGKIREDQHQQAIRDVKGSLILDYVAEQGKYRRSATRKSKRKSTGSPRKRTSPGEKVKEVLVARIPGWRG